jgi:hypothetical protein
MDNGLASWPPASVGGRQLSLETLAVDESAMDKNKKVSLGCGTLILIALIVLILGNAGSDDVSQDIRALRHDLSRLESSVRTLQATLENPSKQLTKIQELLEEERTAGY